MSREEVTGAVNVWVNKGIAAVEKAYAERQRKNDPYEVARQQREVALAEQRRVEAADTARQNRHTNRLRRMGTRVKTGAAVSGSTAALGLADVATGVGAEGLDGVLIGSPSLWFITSAVSGVIAWRTRSKLASAEPPAPLPRPTVPPPILPVGTIGAEEAAQLTRAERQVETMVPVVASLHPPAAQDLESAIATVRPQLSGLIERLDLVGRVDPLQAPHAAEAAEVLRRRLADGVRAYEQLISATTMLLAAPDPGGQASLALEDAAHNLESYAAGLGVASKAFDER